MTDIKTEKLKFKLELWATYWDKLPWQRYSSMIRVIIAQNYGTEDKPTR
jgi:hypothetical protein